MSSEENNLFDFKYNTESNYVVNLENNPFFYEDSKILTLIKKDTV